MKKILTALTLFFFTATNSCYAFNELYYFKNIKTVDVDPIVNNELFASSFNVIKQNPYYAVSQNGDDYAVIILQQSGDNMFYYYQSDRNSKINKYILKEIKKREIVCEQSFNTNIISIYENLANDIVNSAGAVKKYSFEDEEVVLQPVEKVQKNKPQTLTGYVAQISSGTKISAYLQNAVNTATAVKGDQIIAVISDNVEYNGDIVIPQGSLLYGTLSKARSASYGSRNGKIVIDFNQVVTPENKMYNISTETIDFTVSNEGKVTETVKNAATSAAVGALIGLVFGLLSDNRNNWTSAAVGAGVGAGSSLVYSTAEKGVDAEIPSFTELEVVLTKPLSINVSR